MEYEEIVAYYKRVQPHVINCVNQAREKIKEGNWATGLNLLSESKKMSKKFLDKFENALIKENHEENYEKAMKLYEELEEEVQKGFNLLGNTLEGRGLNLVEVKN